jgi:hypothetical protein
MNTYLVNVNVGLKLPLDLPSGDVGTTGPIVGYTRMFGVTATSEPGACEFVVREVLDGAIDWQDSTVKVVGPSQIRSLIGETKMSTEAGIWYRSGRLFYPAEEAVLRDSEANRS